MLDVRLRLLHHNAAALAALVRSLPRMFRVGRNDD